MKSRKSNIVRFLICLFLVSFLGAIQSIMAQNGPVCETFTLKTTADGLGATIVYGVYAVGSKVYAGTSGGLSISTNSGSSFTNYTTSIGLGSNGVKDIYAVGDTVYAATTGGLSISTNSGSSFTNYTSTTNGLGNDAVNSVYAVGSTVYAATYGGGLSISTDGGANFTNKTTLDGLGSNIVWGVYTVDNTVYAATNGGLSISTDGGATFTNKTGIDGLVTSSGYCNVYDVYAIGSTVYAACRGGLSISTNGGTSFTNKTTANGLSDGIVYQVYAIGSTVYAGTRRNLCISTDGGSTFKEKDHPIPVDQHAYGTRTVNGIYVSGDKIYVASNRNLYFCSAPTLGAYPAATLISGQNTSITPTAVPTNSTSIVAYSSANFSGTFTVNPTTGVINVTNAKQASNYPITVKAFQGTSSTTSNFILTVTNPSVSQGNFTGSTEVVVGTNPRSVAIGDFNGDGKQDIATANFGSSSVSIRLGDGNGGFSGSTNVSVATSPRSIAIGDFNGDGKQDIATANYDNVTTSSVSIRLGDGNGGFGGTTEVSVGLGPKSVAVGDFNGDGKQDIVTANDGASSVSIRLGDGNGDFSGSTEVSVGLSPISVAIGDFNGDGKQDIASANSGSSSVSICLGDGNGGFSSNTNVSVGSYPFSVAIGDFNGDGKQDIAAASQGLTSVSIRIGDGNGGFTGNTDVSVENLPNSVAIGDFNGDGNQDIATANFGVSSVSVCLGDGNGSFSNNTNVSVGSQPASVAIGDFNGDGKQDIAASYYGSSSVSIRLGLATNTWTGTTSNLWNVATNWSLVRVPVSTDIVVINTITPRAPQLDVDFIVRNSLTISGTGTLTVNPGKTLSVAAGGTADFGSKSVTFKSDATGTAQLGQVLGTLSNASNVTMERYIPARRAYRFIAAPATTTTTIKQNWMENGNNTAGLGTHITGTLGATNGFDATNSNNASLFSFSSASQVWAVSTNTTASLVAGDAYRLFVRGDRGIDLTNNLAIPTPTVLRTTGTPFVGTKNYTLNSTAGAWNLVGNPYQSTINGKQASFNNVSTYYFAWDPKMANKGAYVSYDLSTGFKTNKDSKINQYFQPGQAFFVQSDGAGTASISFTESMKASASNQTDVFQAAVAYPMLSATLYYTDSLAKNAPGLDGFILLFDNNFSNSVDRNDAQKLTNIDENIAINQGGTLLSIEKRQLYNAATEVQISTSNYVRQQYTVQLSWNNPIDNGFQAQLVDNYTNTTTPIAFSGNTNYVYSVDNTIAASKAADRFKIVFVPNAALPVSGIELGGTATDKQVKLNFKALNEHEMSNYAIERSTDGTSFTTIGTQQPLNAAQASASYSFIDNQPIVGNNYYRIKGSSINGQIQFSNVAVVKYGVHMASVTVVPNPIQGRTVNLRLSQLAKGNYHISVTDAIGRSILKKEMLLDGSSSVQLNLPTSVKAGNYFVKVDGQGNAFIQSFIIQ
jgi:hypothetical protein